MARGALSNSRAQAEEFEFMYKEISDDEDALDQDHEEELCPIIRLTKEENARLR